MALVRWEPKQRRVGPDRQKGSKPSLQYLQSIWWVRNQSSYQHVDLARLKALRELLSSFPLRIRSRLQMLTPNLKWRSTAGGLLRCHERAPERLGVVRHIVRAIVSLGPEVVEFKGRGQLGGVRRNETKGVILSH